MASSSSSEFGFLPCKMGYCEYHKRQRLVQCSHIAARCLQLLLYGSPPHPQNTYTHTWKVCFDLVFSGLESVLERPSSLSKITQLVRCGNKTKFTSVQLLYPFSFHFVVFSEAVQMQNDRRLRPFEKFAIYPDFKSIILDLTLRRYIKFSQII